MFKQILVPTDGSAASEDAVRKSVEFAKETGAQVIGFHSIPEFHIFTYQTDMLEDTREQYRKDSEAQAQKFLAMVETAARDAGVPCQTFYTSNDHPYEAIINAAREHKCDLIAMASHGRKGVRGLLMGSETQKVLTHSLIPVLVFR